MRRKSEKEMHEDRVNALIVGDNASNFIYLLCSFNN